MNGKKPSREGLYTPTQDSDALIKEIEEKWELLSKSDDPEDIEMMYYLNMHLERTVPVMRNFGIKSAIELLGKLGIWMSENDIISIGNTVKTNDDDGHKPNIYR